MSSPQELVDSFISALASQSRSTTTLAVAMSNFNTLRLPNPTYSASGFDWFKNAPKEPIDFVVADLPIGMSREKATIAGQELHLRRNWIELYKALELTADGGYCAALLEPPAFGMGKFGARYLSALSKGGISLIGIINTPPGLLTGTSIRPVITIFQRRKEDCTFVAALSADVPANTLAASLLGRRFGQTLYDGIKLEPNEFSGFSILEPRLQIAKLKTQYTEYDSVSLGDIAVEINAARSGQQHQPKENAIYIPALGTSDVTDDLSASHLKHHNLYQVVLSDKALSQYVSAFFQSELGRLTLLAHRHGVVISRMSKSEVAFVQVALPPLKEQQKIATSYDHLSKLAESVKLFQSELAVNPKNAAVISEQVENMLSQIGALTDSDEVLGLARKGESATAEFKQTFGVDVKTNKREKFIELSSLKTIVAFLNTNGGTLLVGVEDSGSIVGINDEICKFHKTEDKFLLHFKNCLKQRIGEQYYPFIDQKVVDVHGSTILMVKCEPASHPCYLDGEEFYVRTNPATDKLQGPKLVQYVQDHFKSQTRI